VIRLRVGIRLKLLFLSIFLFAIPWLGYQFIWEMEAYLRVGQEQTMVGTARAVATALHERPKLFDNQASYLADVKPGTDLYAHKILDPIQLDGHLSDWVDHQEHAITYDRRHLLGGSQLVEPSMSFRHMVGMYGDYLYAFFAVEDLQLPRAQNSLRIDRNDHLRISMLDNEGIFRRYIIATREDSWVNAFVLEEGSLSLRPKGTESRIQGFWRSTTQGYNIELRIPLNMMSGQIAFALADVDDKQDRQIQYLIGTADPEQSSSLGTVLVPSPEIEKIIRGLKYANARIWVVDKHKRVLARSGDIFQAQGLGTPSSQPSAANLGWWQRFEKHWLLPLYYKILTRPPAEFVDELNDAFALEGQELEQALKGTASTLWHLSPDSKAVILSAAHPIFIADRVMGAVVVEQTTHGIRSLRNKALEKLFNVILAVMSLGTLALFLFASRISSRIRKLRNATELAIDANGKIVGNIDASNTQDEIGDLSRTFHNVLEKLGQYNQYLEKMASRLSHELRTPVAIVNSSLENLQMEYQQAGASAYMQRAKQGISRLSKILSNMSEATRLEQSLQSTEVEEFKLAEVVSGCVEGYRMAYPQQDFQLHLVDTKGQLKGSPELIAQMLDKIVANGLEFSEVDCPIKLTVYKHQSNLCVSVENRGPCLPENMQEQLFDSMVSVRAQDGQQPHLGLGLYIAKLIAEYHRGEVAIANNDEMDGVIVTVMFNQQQG